MSDPLLFLVGLAITAAVLAAFGLLIYAEIQDGQTADAVAAGENHSLDDTVTERPASVT
ncbi:hypothetical protein LRS13_07840 [Svornostia abyssi]|uniref:Uncharacterized protein n=1 Tax=Svornostia abyssi TaxID=2898438 RepID=A0ABY5PM76_9ACTN|nr:hypothetical protein LRS13_07840 [Parviterribacteraceae bacterium J379]